MSDGLVGKMLSEMKKRRRWVAVIGDTMVDRWVHGHTADSQDGCKKFVRGAVIETPGGAANAHRCLSRWGLVVQCELYGFLANDCPVKTRYVEDGKILFRDDDDGPRDRGERYTWVRNMALEMVQQADAVLISDYDKGMMTREYIEQVAKACSARSIPCVADCKRFPEVYQGCIIKCNADYQHRYNESLGRLVFDVERGQRLVATYGQDNPIIWDGAGPLGLGYDLPRVKCVNHVGAGDCFAAHLALGLACGLSLKDSAAVAHSAGRVYVQHPHNRPPHPQEIAADMRGSTSTSTP